MIQIVQASTSPQIWPRIIASGIVQVFVLRVLWYSAASVLAYQLL